MITEISEKEFKEKDSIYSYELKLDTEEANRFNFTSDKYEGYIYVDYGNYHLHCKCIDGLDLDLSILTGKINQSGIPIEDIRNA